MLYHIKPEHVITWGEDATTETIITEQDLKCFSQDWEVPVSELKKQLDPIRGNVYLAVVSSGYSDKAYLTTSKSALACAKLYGRCQSEERVSVFSPAGRLIDKAMYGYGGKYYRVNH